MNKLTVTGLINAYHCFDREFWLAYKTVEKLLDTLEFEKIKLQLLKSKRIPQTLIETIGKEKYEIELLLLDVEWKNKSQLAKEEGTAIHEQIKDLFTSDLKSLKNNFGIDTDLYQVKQTEEFLNCECGVFPEFKMEVKLNDDYFLVGIADLVIKNKNNITIIDWKNSDTISFKSRYDVHKKKSKFMKYPLSKLMDVNGVHYLLQLSFYAKMILLINPELNIECLKIVQIKNGKINKEHCVEYLKDTIESFILWHLKHSTLKEKLSSCKLIDYEKY